MTRIIFFFTALAFAFATLVASAPFSNIHTDPSYGSSSIASKRQATNSGFVAGTNCSDVVGSKNVGDFLVLDNTGSLYPCENIDTGVTSALGFQCYQYTQLDADQGNLGTSTVCPGDPAPSKNPDGSDQTTGATVIQEYCTISTFTDAPAPIEFANLIGCLVFGYWSNLGDPSAQAEAGAVAVCDVIFYGACTFFLNVAPEITEGHGLNTCDTGNPDYGYADTPGLCAFAGPGR